MPSDPNDVPDLGTLSPDGRSWTALGFEWWDAADAASLRPDQLTADADARDAQRQQDQDRKPQPRRRKART